MYIIKRSFIIPLKHSLPTRSLALASGEYVARAQFYSLMAPGVQPALAPLVANSAIPEIIRAV